MSSGNAQIEAAPDAIREGRGDQTVGVWRQRRVGVQEKERVAAAAAAGGRERTPLPALYATVSLDASTELAHERLRGYIERYYGQPLELIRSIQAMYAGEPEGLSSWLEPYVRAGARHIVLRVADERPERGLEVAGQARATVTGELGQGVVKSA